MNKGVGQGNSDLLQCRKEWRLIRVDTHWKGDSLVEATGREFWKFLPEIGIPLGKVHLHPWFHSDLWTGVWSEQEKWQTKEWNHPLMELGFLCLIRWVLERLLQHQLCYSSSDWEKIRMSSIIWTKQHSTYHAKCHWLKTMRALGQMAWPNTLSEIVL